MTLCRINQQKYGAANGREKSRQDAIDDLTLALLYLTSFSDSEGNRFNELAWKNYDFDAISRSDANDFVVDPRGRRHSKYVYLTTKGHRKARELLEEMGITDKEIYDRFEFRTIRQEEADEAADIETICFPPNEVCSRKHMMERVKAAPELFMVAIDRDKGKIAGFLNGIATNEEKFRDEFFTKASLHDPSGKTVMLLGLDVLPEYRKQGLARELVYSYCRKEQENRRLRLVLTCLTNKVKMYKKMGFQDLGESGSSWGGEKWHEMFVRLNFE